MPSVQVVVHEVSGFRVPAASPKLWRQATTGSRRGWSQNRGTAMPSSSAALIPSVPLGTAISKPSMVTVTVPGRGSGADYSLACSVIGPSPFGFAASSSVLSSGASAGQRRRLFPEEGGGGRVERAAAALQVLDVLVAEILDGRHDGRHRAVGERAERPATDVVTDVEEFRQFVLGAVAAFQPGQHPHHPVRAFAARRALTARFVLVELGPAEHR